MILRKLDDGTKYSEVVPAWTDRTAVVIAGGSSLTREQVERVHVAHGTGEVGVIAINDAYLWAPWADVNYFGDSRWWEWQTYGKDLINHQPVAKPRLGLTSDDVVAAFASFRGQKCTVEHSGDKIKDAAVHVLRNLHYPKLSFGLSKEPKAVVTGKNSGFAAFNIAMLSGARRVVLLGYDAHPGENQRHWFGEHPVQTGSQVYEEMRRSFSIAENDVAETGVKVLNCTPGSRLDNFPKFALEEVL